MKENGIIMSNRAANLPVTPTEAQRLLRWAQKHAYNEKAKPLTLPRTQSEEVGARIRSINKFLHEYLRVNFALGSSKRHVRLGDNVHIYAFPEDEKIYGGYDALSGDIKLFVSPDNVSQFLLDDPRQIYYVFHELVHLYSAGPMYLSVDFDDKYRIRAFATRKVGWSRYICTIQEEDNRIKIDTSQSFFHFTEAITDKLSFEAALSYLHADAHKISGCNLRYLYAKQVSVLHSMMVRMAQYAQVSSQWVWLQVVHSFMSGKWDKGFKKVFLKIYGKNAWQILSLYGSGDNELNELIYQYFINMQVGDERVEKKILSEALRQNLLHFQSLS